MMLRAEYLRPLSKGSTEAQQVKAHTFRSLPIQMGVEIPLTCSNYVLRTSR
jgi:hypothetical protein